MTSYRPTSELPPDIMARADVYPGASYAPGSRGTCLTLEEIEEVLGIIASSHTTAEITIGLGDQTYEVTLNPRLEEYRQSLGQTAVEGAA